MDAHSGIALSPPPSLRFARCLMLVALLLVIIPHAGATGEKPSQRSTADGVASSAAPEADQLFGAIVKVHSRAIPDARTAATLGAEREGTGVVIGNNGLILTIGYLIVEADQIDVVDIRGRTLPANIVAYDHTSGLGLVRTVAPLDTAPVALGESTQVGTRVPVMIVNHARRDDVTFAYVVSRRPFVGNWEYQIDHAIFTAPPALNWSGAALFDHDGKLLGVGSLIVRDATGDDEHVPGNMFVPVEVLKPILSDLIARGRRNGPARPWLGVAADELQGHLLVTRVSPEGPADSAGLQAGDIILAIGAEPVRTQTEFYRKLWDSGAAGADVSLKVLQGADVRDIKVHSIDRGDYFRKRTSY